MLESDSTRILVYQKGHYSVPKPWYALCSKDIGPRSLPRTTHTKPMNRIKSVEGQIWSREGSRNRRECLLVTKVDIKTLLTLMTRDIWTQFHPPFLNIRLNPNFQRKASGPDQIYPRLHRSCSNQLSVFLDIFNRSPKTRKFHSSFSNLRLFQSQKRNLYRLSASRCNISYDESVWRNCVSYIRSVLPDSVDPYQFAYNNNQYKDDAVSTCLHHVLQHLEQPMSSSVCPNAYAQILFMGYSSAFNTIGPSKLH